MLDHVIVFSKSGPVLWQRTYCKLQGSPVDDLVRGVLLEERGGAEKTAELGPYALKWTFAAGAGYDIVFVAVYSKLLKLQYVDDLLSSTKTAFVNKFGAELEKYEGDAVDFDADFAKLLAEAESKSIKQRKEKQAGTAVVNKDMQSPSKEVQNGAKSATDSSSNEPSGATSSQDQQPEDEDATDENARKAALAKLQNRFDKSKKGGAAASPGASSTTPGGGKGSGGSSGKKEDRVWSGGSSGKVSAKQMAALDRSRPADGSGGSGGDADAADMASREVYMPSAGEKPQWVEEQEEADAFDAATGSTKTPTASSSASSGWSFSNTYLGGLLQNVTGGKLITKADLEPVMVLIKETLQSKNVAQEIADSICASVSARLEGQALESFQSVHNAATSALKEAIQRVLTPNTSTDILRQVLDAKADGRVFSIVFVGINGVGKSTSLAKVGYFLREHGVKVLIAACDTFRSGAVEQLRTHSRCLDAPLFEQGYSKDPARVAQAALQHAKNNGFDCVLIDTAGRMQNNEKLMRALATLIGENNPDLVLFVGEALVGNDGIDQLTMFDRALVTYSPVERSHRIDGIILTKFDTIDDKVGAALSMSYKSGQPIMFVGTGQKYTHLKRLNVSTVVKNLFSAAA